MTRFRVDPAQSRVWIEARSTLHPIRAESAGLEGWFEGELDGGGRVDPAVAPRAQVTLPVQLLSSGNAFYDREMQRRVESRKYPMIMGELTTMDDAGGDGRYRVGGALTFRGVTRSYSDEMTLSSPDIRTLRLEGQRVFDIRDFGMQPPRILSLRVYPEVTVKILVVADATMPEPVPVAGPGHP